MPKQKSDNFVCRECRHRRNRERESSPREPRLCVHCFRKLNPGEATTEGALQTMLHLAQTGEATKLADFTAPTVPTVPAASGLGLVLVPPRPSTAPIIPAPAPAPAQPLTPFADAEVLAMCEEPEFQLEISLKNRVNLKRDADICKLRIDALNKSLLAFYQRNKIRGVTYDDATVSIMHGSRPTIKAELLLAAGVAADVISRCTDHTRFETIQVREVREAREAGESKAADYPEINS